MNDLMSGSIAVWQLSECMHGCMHRYMHGYLHGYMHGCVHGCMPEGRMNERVLIEQIYEVINE